MNKQVVLSLVEYDEMIQAIQDLKDNVLELETKKLVKVQNTYVYSLYRDVFQQVDDFLVTNYRICEDSLDNELSEIQVNNVKEFNKATNLIKELESDLIEYRNKTIKILNLSFWQKLYFAFSHRF